MQPETLTRPSLPEPDADSAAHSRLVAEYIRERIAQQGGSISFSEFMQHALYAPGLGYYVSGTRKFGAGGDFVTAPEISPLFAEVLAMQIAQLLPALDGGGILEVGAGSGVLAAGVLKTLAQRDALPGQYQIFEVSPDLGERQRLLIDQQIPELASRVRWLSELPQEFTGVIIANEVADALPVERFARLGGETKQFRVVVEEGNFRWSLDDAPDNLQRAVVDIEKYLGSNLPDDYRSEVSLALDAWIGDLVRCLNKGMLFVFDYGMTRREYYAPDQHDGWLRCHFRHHAHNDPLILPGIQDMTAWVDFSALASAGQLAGGSIAGYLSQAHFLLNGGLQEALAEFESLDAEARLELSRQVKLLTLPGEMGENVKCLGIVRGDCAPPTAFRDFDRSDAL